MSDCDITVLPLDGSLTFQEFDGTSLNFEPSPYIEFRGQDHGMLVRINVETGEIEFGPHYTPTAAAEVFWTVLARCPKCNA